MAVGALLALAVGASAIRSIEDLCRRGSNLCESPRPPAPSPRPKASQETPMNRDVIQATALETQSALLATEDHLDRAIAGMAAGTLRLAADRERSGLSLFHTQPILERSVALTQRLVEARGELGRYHRGLEATARMIGLGALASGPVDKPEQGTFPTLEREAAPAD